MERSRSVLVPTIILLALIPVLAALGFWQLQRAQEKRALQHEYDERIDAAPLRMSADMPTTPEQWRFRRVLARGRYDVAHQLLIDNRVHNGAPGYHVITPLQLEGSETRLLVNRGWIPLGESRQRLPDIETPGNVQEIKGTAIVPADKVFTLSEPPRSATGWQTVWPYLDMQRFRTSVSFPIQSVTVLLDADVPHGFLRKWGRLDAGIAVHQGYAFQWFALATLAAVILGVMWYRAGRKKRESK